MIAELKQWWRLIRIGVLIAGTLLSFFALVEVLHVFVILRDVYAPLGYAFLLGTAVSALGLCLWLVAAVRRLPRVLRAPTVDDLQTASRPLCVAYGDYLAAYLARLIDNPLLATSDLSTAGRHLRRLRSSRASKGVHDIREYIRRAEQEAVDPLLQVLDARAEEEIANSVRDIMIGVTLSPYRAADLIVVAYRNAAMILRVMRIYNSRPLLAEQILIFRDVLRVVATVNFMNFGQKLMDQLFSHVPYVGRALEDFAEGIGAGLLTSVAGHGALYRCRAYVGWNREAAVHDLSLHVRRLLTDVKNIFKNDVLNRMRSRVYSTADPDEIKDPGFWEKTRRGTALALEATEGLVETLVVNPLAAGTRGTLRAGSSLVSRGSRLVAAGGRELLTGLRGAARRLWSLTAVFDRGARRQARTAVNAGKETHMERRQRDRRAIAQPVYYLCIDDQDRVIAQDAGLALDINENGMLIESDAPVHSGRVRVMVRSGDGDKLEATGDIIYSMLTADQKYRSGIAFRGMPEATARFVAAFSATALEKQ